MSITTLVIQTQYKENYGDEQNPYWKFKGGSTYFVTDISFADKERIEENGIPTLTSLIEYSNSGSEEYVLDYEVRELGRDGDGKGPICEYWETPIQFRYNGKWLAQTNHTYGEDEYPRQGIIAKAEQWTPLAEGGREKDSFSCQYKVANGWFDHNDPQLKVELDTVDA